MALELMMNDNLFILLIYIGIGLIVSSYVTWTNWMDLNEHAHLIALIYVSFFVTFSWGLWAATFVGITIGDFLEGRLAHKRPIKRINTWWSRQFEQ